MPHPTINPQANYQKQFEVNQNQLNKTLTESKSYLGETLARVVTPSMFEKTGLFMDFMMSIDLFPLSMQAPQVKLDSAVAHFF